MWIQRLINIRTVKRKYTAIIALSLVAAMFVMPPVSICVYAMEKADAMGNNTAKYFAVSSSRVKIGHAVHGETGNLKGNKAGDYKGREIYIENWSYSAFSFSRYHWKYVLRAKDHDLARAIAANMKAVCNNNNIGYDQNSSDNATFYDAAKANGWDIAGVRKKCETTCSNAVSVCLNAEGVKVPRKWNTSRMKESLLGTDLFDCFTEAEYVKSSGKLVPGDILLYPGRHTAIVVESDNPFTYKLSYKNSKGKSVSAQIEEDAEVRVNPNNGTGLMSIKMDGDKNLAEVQVSLKNHDLNGWTRTGDRDFTACYKPKRAQMKISAEKVKI